MERGITRRQALGELVAAGRLLVASRGAQPLGGLAAAAAAAATTVATVAITPTMTEGLYWIDEMLRRFDVRASTLGVLLRGRGPGGRPAGAHDQRPRRVERRRDQRCARRLWHANVYGLYSDESGRPGGTSPADQHRARELPPWLPGDRCRPGCGAAPVDGQVNSGPSGRAGTRAARSTSTCACGRTTGARSRRTTRPRPSSRTPTTHAVLSGERPRPVRRRPDPTTDETETSPTSSAHGDEHRPGHGQHRRRLRGDLHDEALSALRRAP